MKTDDYYYRFLDKEELKHIPDSPGVYRVLNLRTGWSYVGSAGNQGIRRRLLTHLRDLNKSIHHSSRLQEDWDLQHPENFGVEVLAITNAIDSKDEEQLYLDQGVGPSNKSYNTFPSTTIKHHSKEVRERISKAIRSSRKDRRNNSSGFAGVSLHRPTGRWQANIGREGKSYYLGLFDSFDCARGCRETANSLGQEEFLVWFEDLRSKNAAAEKNRRSNSVRDGRNPIKNYVNNTSGYKGVYPVRGTEKSQAILVFGGRRYYLGTFESAKEAHKAYVVARRDIEERKGD